MPTDFHSIDLHLAARRRERLLLGLAGGALLVAAIAVGAVAALAPLKRVEPYLVMVDRSTGAAERVAAIDRIALSDVEALTQAALVSYVVDRESWDATGAQERIESVDARSAGTARAGFRAIWTEGAEEHPPTLYGPKAQVTVTVRNVALLREGVAQVRFEKTLREPDAAPRSAAFVATLGYRFAPKAERRLEDLWANPLGFAVETWRLDAETLAGARFDD